MTPIAMNPTELMELRALAEKAARDLNWLAAGEGHAEGTRKVLRHAAGLLDHFAAQGERLAEAKGLLEAVKDKGTWITQRRRMYRELFAHSQWLEQRDAFLASLPMEGKGTPERDNGTASPAEMARTRSRPSRSGTSLARAVEILEAAMEAPDVLARDFINDALYHLTSVDLPMEGKAP